jgi:hypothetical protein
MKAITVQPHTPGSSRFDDVPEPDTRDGSVLVEDRRRRVRDRRRDRRRQIRVGATGQAAARTRPRVARPRRRPRSGQRVPRRRPRRRHRAGPYAMSTVMVGEAATTFALVATLCVCLGVRHLRQYTPFAMPWSYAVIVPLEAQISGTSTNPARTFGPALISGRWDGWWIYWVGPMMGTPAAILVFSSIARRIEVAKRTHVQRAQFASTVFWRPSQGSRVTSHRSSRAGVGCGNLRKSNRILGSELAANQLWNAKTPPRGLRNISWDLCGSRSSTGF